VVLRIRRVVVDLGHTFASLYNSAVQAGFVAGTLIVAVLGFAARLKP
jgi:hypothetical protein